MTRCDLFYIHIYPNRKLAFLFAIVFAIRLATLFYSHFVIFFATKFVFLVANLFDITIRILSVTIGPVISQ